MTTWPIHGRISGPIVMIGFGSIGRGTLPLIERHFTFDKSRFVVIDPEDKDRALLDERGIRFLNRAVTRDNYPRCPRPAADRRRGPGLLRQPRPSIPRRVAPHGTCAGRSGLSTIDTVIEPWAGFYFDKSAGPEARTNYALRDDPCSRHARRSARR